MDIDVEIEGSRENVWGTDVWTREASVRAPGGPRRLLNKPTGRKW